MSAEGLRKAVFEKARAEAGEILARARKAADTALTSSAERAQREAAEAVETARRDAARDRARALSSVEREMRVKALDEKNRLLEEVLSRAAREFARLPGEELNRLYAKELKALDLQGATVHVPRGAAGAFEAILAGRAAAREDGSVQAGYVVVHEDFRLDRSLAARREELRTEMRTELARVLFGEKE